MKKAYYSLLYVISGLLSCQKNISDFDPSQQPAIAATENLVGTSSIIAIIDYRSLVFTVISATLTHSAITNEKRIDIAAISTDNTKKIAITLGEQSSKGNEISKKEYTLNAYQDDNPATLNVNESEHFEGYTSYGTSNNTGWKFESYDEAGSCTINKCDTSAALISGVFATTLRLKTDKTQIIKITSGRIINVKYRVIN